MRVSIVHSSVSLFLSSPLLSLPSLSPPRIISFSSMRTSKNGGNRGPIQRYETRGGRKERTREGGRERDGHRHHHHYHQHPRLTAPYRSRHCSPRGPFCPYCAVTSRFYGNSIGFVGEDEEGKDGRWAGREKSAATSAFPQVPFNPHIRNHRRNYIRKLIRKTQD